MADNLTVNRTILPIPQIQQPLTTPVDARKAPKPEPAKPLRPPAGAPNVLIILIDDMGFGASSAFGGPCHMPTAERLAANGLKYNRAHTTALCSPTRQAMLTGRNHHSVNMGGIAEVATSLPGYTGIRPDSAATIAQILKYNGYNTAAFGKMHQTPPWESSLSGPFDRWPTGDGFEKFYGFLGGDCNQYSPPLIDSTIPVEPPKTTEEGYHLSEDLADQAIAWVRAQQSLTPDKPFFIYMSFGATHAPHHVPKAWIDNYKGKFDQGWDKQREMTLAKQKELGVVPPDCQLTQRHTEIPAWEDMTDADRTVAARLMETYAGFAEHTDHQVGQLVDAIKQIGVLDNTLIFYILGDNGASAEAGPYGTFNEMALQNMVQQTTNQILPHLDEIGGPKAFNHYNCGWAHAMNAPYQWSKVVASHWGGTRTGMVVHYPTGIQAKGEIRSQFTHVIDIAPTILELAKLPAPIFVNGIQQKPIEGISFAYTFNEAKAPDHHLTQYFEIGANRGIYHEGWTACTHHSMPWTVPGEQLHAFDDDVWELYAPEDWSQANNLAAQQPGKLRELQQLFLIEGAKYNVLPLDDRKYERLNAAIAGRPDLMGERTSLTLYSGMGRLNENTVPNVKNCSFSITTEIVVPESGAEGAIISQGGAFAGWCLYLKDSVPAYCHNWVGLELYYVRSNAHLAPGKHKIRYEFAYDGGGVGKGGTGTLYVDDAQVGQGRIEKTVPLIFSYDDFLDVGKDTGEPVTPDYTTPKGEFTGEIAYVTIDVSGDDMHYDHAAKEKALLMKQ